ncbi:MAG: sigma-70 family RNA polymerase sigma factor [Solirubrobacterales bacterium]
MEAASTILRELPARRRAQSFERECERLRPLGEAYIVHRFGGSLSRADAEDAVAEVLIRLHRLAAAGRAPQNLRGAFFTSVRNAAIDLLRSRATKPTVALDVVSAAPTTVPSPLEWTESHDDANRLQEALGRMRTNYREVLLLRFGLGLTVPEIARQLGVSLPAATKLVLRATQQVRKRLEAIEGQEFCPEMRELARDALFEKEASGLASEAEERILHAHFKHCGPCRSFLASLHDNLHELGSGVLVAGAATEELGRVGPLAHLSRWFGHASHAGQAAAAKLRFAAFRATGALQPSDGGTAGALAGTGQKIAAICTAGAATTATCLATGIIGPGIGISAPPPSSGHHLPPPQVRTVPADPTPTPSPAVEAPASAPTHEPKPTPEPSSAQDSQPSSQPETASPPSETPTQREQTQFGFEGSASSGSAPSSTSAPPPTPPSSSAHSASSSSTAGAKGGTESFGFHG